VCNFSFELARLNASQGNIYCTELTEKLLRSLEPNLERVKYDVGLLPKRTQPYRFKSNRDGTPRVNFVRSPE
jgi:hypothetical protein